MATKKSEVGTVCPKCGRQDFYVEFRENNNSYKLMCVHCKDTYVKFIGSTGYQELKRLNRINPKPEEPVYPVLTSEPPVDTSKKQPEKPSCSLCTTGTECLADINGSPLVLIIREGVLQLIDTASNSCLAEYRPTYCPKCGVKL